MVTFQTGRIFLGLGHYHPVVTLSSHAIISSSHLLKDGQTAALDNELDGLWPPLERLHVRSAEALTMTGDFASTRRSASNHILRCGKSNHSSAIAYGLFSAHDVKF